MGTLADSLFTVLMSWVRALVNGFWALFDAEHTTFLEFLGKNWVMIVLVIVAAGLLIDWLIWAIRWKPYSRLLKKLGFGEKEVQKAPQKQRAHAALRPERPAPAIPETPAGAETGNWMPLARPTEADARAAMEEARSVPDEELRAYPGMKYGAQPAASEGTQRYSAIHQEGPGAAEVEKRRREIEAWQQQMQEEARQKAEQERAAQEAEQRRLAQEAYEKEQQRLAQEAYEKEQQRLAQEAYEKEQQRLAQEAYEKEQQRLIAQAQEQEQQRAAQAEYERQMAEYRAKQAQYERDLAEYQRQMAAYEENLRVQEGTHHRRPPAPQTAPEEQPEEQRVQPQTRHESGLMGRMARMIEPEEEELSALHSLPPRVNKEDAYGPARKPRQTGRRRR